MVNQFCVRCRLPERVCVCARLPQAQAALAITIVRHVGERTRVSNSAHLVALTLPTARIIDYGAQGAPVEAIQIPRTPGTYLLFPEGPAREDLASLPHPLDHLVVLDASWSQVRRMRHRLPALAGMPPLRVAASAQRRRMRAPPKAGLVSTLEAIALALELAGEPQAAIALEATYDTFTAAMMRLGRTGHL